MLGASPKRKEDRRLLTGAGRFVEDVTPANTARLGVVRSVHAHARLRAVDLKVARQRPGVLAAWAAGDLADLARSVPAAWGGSHKGRPFAVPLLAAERVRYVGEPIAVVIAEDAPRLHDALEAVAVDYEPLPALATIDTALASATRLHEGWSDNSTLPVSAKVGDADAGFARAEVTVGGRFRHPRLAAVPIEPRGAVAWPDRDAIGKRLKLGFGRPDQQPWLTVVGLVGDIRQRALAEATTPTIFVFTPNPFRTAAQAQMPDPCPIGT